MAADHEALRELLGVWAVGAGMPGDEDRVLAHLADCAACAAEAGRLRATVRLLDGGADAGPGRVGRRMLDAALRSRPAAQGVAAHAAPYAAAVAGLEALLRELGERGPWGTPVIHDWDVHGTVAHLVAADEPLAAHLGLQPRVPAPGAAGAPADAPTGKWQDGWEARTAAVIAYEHRREPVETFATWRDQARTLLATRAAHDLELAAGATELMGLRLPVTDHFLIRAFETWVHTDDIGRALGRSVPPPLDAHLSRLVGLGVRILDLALGRRATPVLLAIAGPGPDRYGEEWVLGSDAEPVAAELVLDPVDFCLLLGGRYAPDEVPRGIGGDPLAATAVLELAASLAWL
ncbi:MAG TPA: maleylpyruvate isomerase N-terminal domain-containing protein [Streptomyces sp.]|nr:maleylpyruvate isomerase N-terminal domain-containing protein [Streptomyces sp.]